MKLNRYIFITTSLVILILVATSLNSCEYLVESSKGDATRATESNQVISLQKDEAKLLVEASKYNLDVIELCNIIEEEKVDEDVKDLVEEIKNEQLAVLEKYNEVASENVISIPRYSNLKQEEISKLNDSVSLEIHLKLLSSKIQNQKELLDKLSDTTNNRSFKSLAESANTTLEKSLDKTEETIKIIHTDS
ncbi:hypothetical protein [Kordia sp.]|uniref:hypothetical protein n=1 Tax=Kordia sp. TaxID=1965332 RepID=UPI003D29E08A